MIEFELIEPHVWQGLGRLDAISSFTDNYIILIKYTNLPTQAPVSWPIILSISG